MLLDAAGMINLAADDADGSEAIGDRRIVYHTSWKVAGAARSIVSMMASSPPKMSVMAAVGRLSGAASRRLSAVPSEPTLAAAP
jgi:hypothetical protein